MKKQDFGGHFYYVKLNSGPFLFYSSYKKIAPSYVKIDFNIERNPSTFHIDIINGHVSKSIAIATIFELDS